MASYKQGLASLLNEKHLLTSVSIALSEVNQGTDIPALLVEQLQKITGSFLVAYFDYDHDQRVFIPCLIKARHKTVQKGVQDLEHEILKQGMPVSDTAYQQFIDHPIGFSTTLHDISFGAISEALENTIRSALIFNRYYWITFPISDVLYGASLVGLREDQPAPSDELLHFFSWMAAITLRRNKEDARINKIRELEVRQSEEKYRLLAEHSADVIWILKTDGKFSYISPSIEKLRGYTPDEVMTQSLAEILTPNSFLKVVKLMGDTEAKIKQGASYINPTPVVLEQPCRDGSTVWTEAMVQAMFDETGKHTGYLGITRDITERLKAEEELRRVELHFQALIENATDGVVLVNHLGQFKYISPSAKKIFSYQDEDNDIGSPDQLTHPEDLPMVQKHLGQLIEDPSYVPVLRYRFLAKDGSWRWIESKFTNMFAETSVEAIVINFRDITDRKNAEEEIKTLNLSLEKRVEQRTSELLAANKELEAFAYTVSHDLRAPVRAIDGFAKIIEDDYLSHIDGECKRLFGIIHENTHRMEHLIDDLLSFSRLSRTDMSYSTINMGEIIWKCYNEYTPAELRSKINMTVSDFPLVRGDYAMLVQVWTNLISNAVKYSSHTEHPEIRIETSRMENELVFSITDNGIGFDMKYADKLFGVFQRLHTTKEFDGTGVGLAIVQRIIHRHGGRVWAKGAVKKGATFSFTLRPEESPASSRL